MTKQKGRAKKGTDEELLRLANLGMSRTTIGSIFNAHPTAIGARLKRLKAPVLDTRRAFMEDIYGSMTAEEQEWVANQLHGSMTIQDYIRNLLKAEYERNHGH